MADLGTDFFQREYSSKHIHTHAVTYQLYIYKGPFKLGDKAFVAFFQLSNDIWTVESNNYVSAKV